MEGPIRMRDDAGVGLRRILASSALDEPPADALKRTLAAAAGAAATAATVSAVAKTGAAQSAGTLLAGTGALGLAKWAGIGIAVGLIGLGTLKLTGVISPATAPEAAPTRRVVAPEVPTETMIRQEPVPAASASAAPSAKVDEPRVVVVPSAAPTNSSLAVEMQELEQVRRAIAQGRAGEAINLLDAFAAQHPRARLSEEAAVLRIEALVASGAAEEAKRRAGEYLRAHPDSAFGDRIRTITGVRTEP